MSKRLQFFQTDVEVLEYIIRELLSTLDDDYQLCRVKDPETARELKKKIHDIRLIENRITLN